MPETVCPKCRQKSDDSTQCTKCGINFAEYTEEKHRRLGEVSRLLEDGKFTEAKKIADRLPFDFPDNRNDFLLLLSNINRDISIVEKCRLAQKCYIDGDYVQASFLLRNIKAFDQKLDEQVIILRRKIERKTQSIDIFNQAVEAFDRGDYGSARELFGKADKGQHGEKLAGYLEKIEEIKSSLLKDAIEAIKDSRLAGAGKRFEHLRIAFPELGNRADEYLNVVAKREEVQGNILYAAQQAEMEKRYLEAKILYLFLGIRFPDTRQVAQLHAAEIGDKAIVTFADLDNYGIVNLSELGLDADIDGTVSFQAVPEEVTRDISPGKFPDIQADVVTESEKVEASQDVAADSVRKPSDFGGVEVADFIF